MKLYSTNNPKHLVGLEEAVFQSLPPDNGLYMPCEIPVLPQTFTEHLGDQSFQDISFEVARALLGHSVDAAALKKIVEEALDFPAPVVQLEDQINVLELFHGPSMAFKDFGARFMSRLMAYFLKKRSEEIHILVATSGDTGGAVALGFYEVPGIKVTILYPSGKVSPIQEKQLTSLDKNISTLEIEGTFDDCQRMVKQAFLDPELQSKMNLSSANSINISRLIPQTFYYFNAFAQLQRKGNKLPVVFSVPSGNFGNLTAGLIAQRMGLPVAHFIASTNVNDEVPQYLKTGVFEPRPSLHTISNAMDVGNPSNFARMLALFEEDVMQMRKQISGFSFTDEQTKAAIKKVFDEHRYILCPHTAVAYLGLKQYLENHKNLAGLFLSTAHPCKFPGVYSEEIRKAVNIPAQANTLRNKEKRAIKMKNDFSEFRNFLLSKA